MRHPRYADCVEDRLYCGIYAIVNMMTGDEYIGKSSDIRRRWQAHCSYLNCDTRGAESAAFREAWKEYGAGAFRFIILQECRWGQLTHLEDQYIQDRKPAYNIRKKASTI